jgi:Chaperonin 10 Kd subunit
MKKAAFEAKKIKSIRALRDHVLVTDMYFGQRRLGSGIIILNDDGKGEGIRPRWARVFAIGPDQQDVTVGQWVLVAHGRWTRANEIEVEGEKKSLRRVDHNDILLVSDEQPADADGVSDAVSIHAKTLDR